MDYGFLDRQVVTNLKDSVVGKVCNNKCNGTGVLFENNVIVDCVCIKEFLSKVKYLGAGIPKKYWDFNLRNLLGKFEVDNRISIELIKNYCKKVSDMVKEGVGLYLQGESGLAKSALAYYILKEALKQNIICYSIRMSHLSELLYDSQRDEIKLSKVEWIREEVELLMIDEIDKDYKVDSTVSFVGNQVNMFFSDMYDCGKSLIVTSNVPKTGLSGIQADNVIDRLSELADIVFIGESYRKANEAVNKIMKV